MSMDQLMPENLEPAVEALIEAALAEDLGEVGDLTSKFFVAADERSKGVIAARERGVAAGIDVAVRVFELVDAGVVAKAKCADGTELEEGTVLIDLEGDSQSILTAERTALNFLQRLSGIATATREYCDLIEGTGAVILDTRKTMPGWRWLDKMAVRAGGGQNHRMGLYDRVMLKDNHLAALDPAQMQVKIDAFKAEHPKVEIEIETDNLDQVRRFLELKNVDYLLLDNMSLDQLRSAVAMNETPIKLEASGGVNLETVRSIAETGVDFISVGALTHSVKALDIGLDFS
ncbi:MAG: carboxylating nicotinate-nucleotide diphosphorylase [Verrucomicrobiota bacterium]